jgi:hypothetical protein
VSRQGIRGGTIHSLAEAEVAHDLHKRRLVELVDSAIWETLQRKGEVHANDLQHMPEAAIDLIGNRIGVLARKKLVWEADRLRPTNPASHGRKSGLWRLTSKGRVELERRVGVGGGTTTSSSDYSAAPHPGSARLDSAPLPRPGGGDTNSQPGTVAAPETLQLDLGTPQRPGHFDDWDVAA